MLDNKDQKYACIFGNNIDKGQLNKEKKVLSRDKDIRSMIWYSKIRMLCSIIIAVMAIIGVFQNIAGGYQEYVQHISAKGWKSYIFDLVIIIITCFAITNDFKSLSEESMNFFNCCRHIFLGSMNPLKYWNVNLGSVSDVQIAGALSRNIDGDVEHYYSGIPCFQVRAIDSIVLSIDVKGIPPFKIRRLYRKCLHEFYIKTYIGNADEKLFEDNERRISASNSVFGILFMSKFLMEIYNKYVNVEGDKPKKKIRIGVDGKGLIASPDQFEKREFAETFLKYCTSPKYFEWSDCTKCSDNNDSVIINIEDISFIDDAKRKQSYCKKSIRIPVKRHVAIPSDQMEEKLNTGTLLFPGGAEQNLGLQYYINKYIWRSEEKYGPSLGFAENAFCDYRGNDFLVGTEGLVYGVTELIKSRDQKKLKSVAEVINFGWENLNCFCVYGYSAIATKMSIIVLLYRLQILKDMNVENTVTSERVPGRFNNKLFLLTFNPDYLDKENSAELGQNRFFFHSKMVKDWDNGVINSDDELKTWIETYEKSFMIEQEQGNDE